MKFPFIKSKNVFNTNAENNVANQILIAAKLQEQLPTHADTVKIKYKLLSSVGRKGEKFAAKLAESGDEVFYSTKGSHQYYIT